MGLSFFMRLASRPLPVSVLTFSGCERLLSLRFIFLSRMVCDQDRLSCSSHVR